MNKKIGAITVVVIFLLTTIGSISALGFEVKKLSTEEVKIDELFVETSTLETISGTVVGRGYLFSQPLAGAMVKLLNPNGTVIDWCVTGCHGQFYFSDVEIPARYILTFQADDYRSLTIDRYFETPKDCDLGTIVLQSTNTKITNIPMNYLFLSFTQEISV